VVQSGDGQSAGRFEDRTGIVEDVLDGGTNLVVRDEDDLVDDALCQRESMEADLANGDAIREDAT
jgi:hypothetical protein